MTGNRGRGSRFQIWVAVDATDDDGGDEDPVAGALRLRANDAERPTLLRPAAAVSQAAPDQPTSLMVAAVMSSPVWSSRDYEYVAAPVPTPPPAPVVVATPPMPAAPPPSQPPTRRSNRRQTPSTGRRPSRRPTPAPSRRPRVRPSRRSAEDYGTASDV